jgi:hypothetical protein
MPKLDMLRKTFATLAPLAAALCALTANAQIDDPEIDPTEICGVYRVFTYEGANLTSTQCGGVPITSDEALDGAVADATAGLVSQVTCPPGCFPQSACQPDYVILDVTAVTSTSDGICWEVTIIGSGAVGVGCSPCPGL